LADINGRWQQQPVAGTAAIGPTDSHRGVLTRERTAYREINCPQHVNAAGKLLTKLDDAYGW
jgi:hypothetical protein